MGGGLATTHRSSSVAIGPTLFRAWPLGTRLVADRELDMLLAERVRAHRILALGVAGTLIGSATLVAAGPAHAVEVYPRPSGGTVAITGHGYGHGHGMSQWGAYGAAAVGKLSWQSILAFYYTGP